MENYTEIINFYNNFCIIINFIIFAKLKHKLWQTKTKYQEQEEEQYLHRRHNENCANKTDKILSYYYEYNNGC